MTRNRWYGLILAGLVALAGATPASAANVLDCDDLDDALAASVVGETVTVAEGLHCTGAWTLPPHMIVLAGGGLGATLDGDDEQRILQGADVGATTFRNLDLVNGDANGQGGAIRVTGDSPVTIEDVGFFGNEATGDGGAVYVDNDDAEAPVVVRDSRFGSASAGNEAGDDGGGLHVISGTLELTGSAFVNNTATGDGGGASARLCSGGQVTGTTFDGNHLLGEGDELYGGGLALEAICPNVEEVAAALVDEKAFDVVQSGNRFLNNTAEAESGVINGGGESIEGLAVVSTDDRFVANALTGGNGRIGGGLYVENADFTGRNLVAAANTAPGGAGGGVYAGNEGNPITLTLVNATVVNNTAAGGAGIDGDRNDSLVLHNSIVHGNIGESEISGFDPPLVEGPVEGGRDVRYTLTCLGTLPHPGEGNVCADPKLEAPATGNVHETAASPTLEAASNALADGIATDYEGQGRILDADGKDGARVDMGADERPAPPPPVVVTPAATGGVQGTTVHRCVSRRSFRIRLRTRGQKVVKATVYVNGHKVKVLRGKRLTARVNLRGLPRGRFSVRIVLELADGRKITGVRRYHTCTAARPAKRPPPV